MNKRDQDELAARDPTRAERTRSATRRVAILNLADDLRRNRNTTNQMLQLFEIIENSDCPGQQNEHRPRALGNNKVNKGSLGSTTTHSRYRTIRTLG